MILEVSANLLRRRATQLVPSKAVNRGAEACPRKGEQRETTNGQQCAVQESSIHIPMQRTDPAVLDPSRNRRFTIHDEAAQRW